MMGNVSGASLDPIFQRLRNAPTYHPLEADTFADWGLEAGDTVTVERDGQQYSSPVQGATMTWKKTPTVTLSATGNEERDSVTKQSAKKYGSGGSGLRDSHYKNIFVEDQYRQMVSGLELTGYSAHLYVDGKYSQMSAGLKLAEDSARLYVDNKYSQMQAGLDLTSSAAHLYVDNAYRQMSAGLKVTSSWARLYVDDKYSQMQAGLYLTSSAAHLHVDNAYTQMAAGLVLAEDSAKLYARDRTTRAYIMVRINADGEGEALIEAHKVRITGDTTLYGSMTISGEGYLEVKRSLTVNGSIYMRGSESLAHLYGASILNNLNFGSGASAYSMNREIVGGMIKDAAASDGVLTLTKFDGTEINFSKVVNLQDSWIDGDTKQMNVTSNPSPVRSYTYSFPVTNSKTLGHKVTVTRKGDQGQTLQIGSIDLSAIYNAGKTDVMEDNPITVGNASVTDGDPGGNIFTTLQTNISNAMNNPDNYRGRYMYFVINAGGTSKRYKIRFGS